MDLSPASSASLALIKLYESSSDAWNAPGVGAEEVNLVAELADAVARISERATSRATPADHYLAVVSAAFLRANQAHWARSKTLLKRPRKRCADAIATALFTLQGLRPYRTQPMDILLGDPIATPVHAFLWGSFVEAEPPLLNIAGPSRNGAGPASQAPHRTGRREFERDLARFFASLATAETGRGMVAARTECQLDAARIIQTLIARDTFSWMNRHVFGNLRRHPDLPPMPLSGMYVEPKATRENGETLLVQTWIRERLQAPVPTVMVVSAGSGHGKSLSARHLAATLAREYLQGSEGGPRAWYPVYVRARQGLDVRDNRIGSIVARAMGRQANDLEGLRLGLDRADPALTPPAGRSLIIIDGFDELELAPMEAERFFDLLRDASSETCRFLVLGRPASMQAQLNDPSRWNIDTVQLRGFDQQDVRAWLTQWNSYAQPGRGIDVDILESARFASLAETPILLFMIASEAGHLGRTDVSATTTRPLDAVGLYESFCCAMAKDSLDSGRPGSRAAALAVSKLADRLLKHGWLRSTPPGERATEAMLWLMARVAWAQANSPSEQALRHRHVEAVLEDELGLSDADVQAVLVGALLAIQPDVGSGRPAIFFGHRSFQDYLIARWWHIAIGRASAIRPPDELARFEQRNLLGAHVLAWPEARSFFFALERTRDDASRAGVAAWADACFCSNRVALAPAIEDARARLRATALAVACAAEPNLDLARPERNNPLRCLLAASWAQGGIRLGLTDANLRGVDLRGADLQGADLQGADLQGADLQGTNLRAANLQGAHLQRARLQRADLQTANLRGAVLHRANLQRADLQTASLRGAILQGALLHEAVLRGAFLQRADLEGSYLEGAFLEGAFLQGAILQRALLEGALLEGANLQGAFLNGASLQGAALQGADLRGAHLQGADLRGAVLEGAVFQRADLRGAALDGAFRDGACFDGAVLRETDLSGWEYDADTVLSPPLDPEMPGTARAETTRATR